jgi:hypothetical protein
MATTEVSSRTVSWALCVGACLLVGWLGSPQTADATTMEYTNLEELVEISEVALRGTVVDRETFRRESTDRIVTHTTISVDEAYIGEPGETVTIEQWGGTHDGETVVIPGDAAFESDEEVVVFLKTADERDVHFLSVLAQSKYRLVRRDDGTIRLERDLSDIEFPDGESPPDDRIRTFEAFLDRLRALLETSASKPPSDDSP